MPEPTAPETSAPTPITYADFERVDIRVGTITDAQQDLGAPRFPIEDTSAHHIWIAESCAIPVESKDSN